MKTWNDIKLNDYIYLLKWHTSGYGYVEIRRSKVIEIRKPIKDYIYIKFRHPENTNDKGLDWMKTDRVEWMLKSTDSISDTDFNKKHRKFLLLSEFNENIVEEFEKIHRK